MNQETQFFDYIATSVWSIIELLENDFEGMFDKENYKIVNLMKDGDDQFIVINTRYFIRCKHEFKKTLNQKFMVENYKEKKIDDKELDDFIETMKRRKERFLNLFSSNKSILFLRYEEDPTGRLDFPEYEEKMRIPFIDNLKKLSDVFKKMNPSKKVFILDVSHRNEKSEYMEEHRIIKIKMEKRVDHWIKASRMMTETLEKTGRLFEKICL